MLNQAAVEGKNMSGVTVATMITSMSDGVMPRSAKVFLAASTARSLVATPLSTKVAFPNSGAFHDPVMVRLDHLLEILVSQKARRDIRSQSADFGANRLIQ
jgi:hypothetical protein